MRKIVLFIFAIISFTQVNAQVCFSPLNLIWTGNFCSYHNVTNADFNGDGKIDLAMANEYKDSINIFFGTGAGNFGAPSVIKNVNSANILSADFNGDGNTDIAGIGPAGLSILLGTGVGTFSTSINIPSVTGSSFTSFISADFNGDTKADLAMLIFTDSVTILLGTGTGSFSSIKSYAVGVEPYKISCADFNEDGHLDIVTSNGYNSNDLSILLGVGNGSLGTATTIPLALTPASIVCADFNGDTHVDIATFTDSLNILLGTGTGSFGAITKYEGIVPGFIGDFNGDGNIDLAGLNDDFGNIPLCLGTGTGKFLNPVLLAANSYTANVTCADFNADGKTDVAVTGATTNNVESTLFVFLTCNSTTGINDLGVINDELKAWPNPASTNLQVAVSSGQIAGVRMYDVLGNAISAGHVELVATSAQIDVSNLTNGVYFVEVRTREGTCTKKVIVQH